MAIDQTKLGNHIQEQMQAIEQDPEISDNAQIGDIVTVVEIIDPVAGNATFKPGDQVEIRRNVRARHSGMPHAGIGLLEEAKWSLLSQ